MPSDALHGAVPMLAQARPDSPALTVTIAVVLVILILVASMSWQRTEKLSVRLRMPG